MAYYMLKNFRLYGFNTFGKAPVVLRSSPKKVSCRNGSCSWNLSFDYCTGVLFNPASSDFFQTKGVDLIVSDNDIKNGLYVGSISTLVVGTGLECIVDAPTGFGYEWEVMEYDSKKGKYITKTVRSVAFSVDNNSYAGAVPCVCVKYNTPKKLYIKIPKATKVKSVNVYFDDSLIKQELKTDTFYKNLTTKQSFYVNPDNIIYYPLYIYCNDKFINEYGKVDVIAKYKNKLLPVNYEKDKLKIDVSSINEDEFDITVVGYITK